MTHTFTPYPGPRRTDPSCLKCGRVAHHPIHTTEATEETVSGVDRTSIADGMYTEYTHTGCHDWIDRIHTDRVTCPRCNETLGVTY